MDRRLRGGLCKAGGGEGGRTAEVGIDGTAGMLLPAATETGHGSAGQLHEEQGGVVGGGGEGARGEGDVLRRGRGDPAGAQEGTEYAGSGGQGAGRRIGRGPAGRAGAQVVV